MIYDTLNNLPNYLGVSDNLDTVIEIFFFFFFFFLVLN